MRYPDSPFFYRGRLNSRVGNLHQLDEDILPYSRNVSNKRESLDKIISKRGENVVECMESNECILINGRTSKDNPAQFTFVSTKGKSTIDLIWANFDGISITHDMGILHFITGLDHFPAVITLNIYVVGK